MLPPSDPSPHPLAHSPTLSPQPGDKKPLMPLEEALSRIRAAVQPLPQQAKPLAECLGHVLARDVLAQASVPAFDNSAMDGYALRSQDALAAGPDHVWPVSQRVPAGSQPQPLQPGTVARLFTGAPLPQGADAVVPQEQAQVGEDGGVRLSAPLRPGQHVRRLGEDFQQGDLLLRAGVRLTPAHLGLAASAGLPGLWVSPRPRVALVSTGDELVQPGQPLPEGGIYDANRFSLTGLLQAWGIPFVDLGRVPDTLEGSRSALAQAAAQADVVLSSGGVSVGEEDHWRAALSALGQVHAWALAIKPGKPLTFGQVPGPQGRTVQVLGLPGNPVAAVVTALLALDPLLAALEGAEASPPKAWPMIAGFDWPRPDARREFLRASLGEDGRLQLHPRQGSAMLTSCTGSDGLIDNPPGQAIQPGDVVRFLPWGSWGLRD